MSWMISSLSGVRGPVPPGLSSAGRRGAPDRGPASGETASRDSPRQTPSARSASSRDRPRPWARCRSTCCRSGRPAPSGAPTSVITTCAGHGRDRRGRLLRGQPARARRPARRSARPEPPAIAARPQAVSRATRPSRSRRRAGSRPRSTAGCASGERPTLRERARDLGVSGRRDQRVAGRSGRACRPSAPPRDRPCWEPARGASTA